MPNAFLRKTGFRSHSLINQNDEGVQNKRYSILGGSSFRLKKHEENIVKLPSDSKIFKYTGFLLDMDGVLQKNGVPIKGAAKFLDKLRKYNCPFILLTNECRYTNEDLSDKLSNILGKGHPKPFEIYSSANSTKDFFERMLRNGYNKSVYVIGEKGLIENIKKAYSKFQNVTAKVISGMEVHDENILPVGYVVIGSVFEENTRNTERAANFIIKGAKLVHTCPDLFDYHSDGRISFGMPMSTVYLLENSCNVTSYNLGKPNPHMLRMAQSKLMIRRDLNWSDILFVGDSINTDIRTSIENGIDCVLLLSGCSSIENLKRSPLKPNYVFKNIDELLQMYFCRESNSMKIASHYKFE